MTNCHNSFPIHSPCDGTGDPHIYGSSATDGSPDVASSDFKLCSSDFKLCSRLILHSISFDSLRGQS